jgi:hypothetical protein
VNVTPTTAVTLGGFWNVLVPSRACQRLAVSGGNKRNLTNSLNPVSSSGYAGYTNNISFSYELYKIQKKNNKGKKKKKKTKQITIHTITDVREIGAPISLMSLSPTFLFEELTSPVF